MKKLNFKFLSALLAVAMLLSTAPVMVFAEDAVVDPLPAAEKACYIGKIVDWTFDDLAEQTLTGESGNITAATGTNGTYNFYLTEGKTATIGSESGRGNVLKVQSTTQNQKTTLAGVADSVFAAYNAANGTPSKFKIEFDVSQEQNYKVFYVEMSGKEVLRRSSTQFMTYNASTKVADIGDTYAYNNWVTVTMYLDTEEDTCAIYLDGKYIADHTNLPDAVKDGLTSIRFTTNAHTDPIKVDNVKVYAYKPLAIESTNITKGATNVFADTNFVATFSDNLPSGLDSSCVTVTGANVPSYSVSASGKELTVAFDKPLSTNTDYKVTINPFPGFLAEATYTFKTGAIYDSMYTGKIADFDFNNLTANLEGGTNNMASDGLGNTYYVTSGKTATLVTESNRGNAVEIRTSGNFDTQIGVPNSAFTAYSTANGEPTKFKVEVDAKHVTNWKSVYIRVNGDKEIMTWAGGTGEFKFSSGSYGARNKLFTLDGCKAGNWTKVTLYFDLDEGQYYIYINGAYQDVATIPSAMTSLTELRLTGNASHTIRFDNIKVYAVTPFALTDTDIAATANPDLKSYTATFNKELGTVTNEMVTITSDEGTVPAHSVSVSGKNLTVNFNGTFTPDKAYTITFDAAISTKDGLQNLGAAVSKTFTTTSGYPDVGFDTNIVDIDFDKEFKLGDVVKDDDKYYFGDESHTNTVEIVNDPDGKRGLVAAVPRKPNSGAVGFGIRYNYTQTVDPAYLSGIKEYSQIVKLTIDYRRSDAARTGEVMVFGGTNYNVGLIKMGVNGTSGYQFYNGTAYTGNVGPERDLKWHTLELYFDFVERNYYVYIDGVYLDVYTIPTKMTDLRGVQVLGYNYSTAAAVTYVDRIKIDTISVYDSPIIAEYRLPSAAKTTTMAFAYDNTGAATSIKVILAKYDRDGLLIDTEIEEVEVGEKTALLKKLGHPTIPSGGSAKYFVWEGFDTMKPIINVKDFR